MLTFEDLDGTAFELKARWPRRPSIGTAARAPIPTELAEPRLARAGETPKDDGAMAAAPAMAVATEKTVASVGLAMLIGGTATVEAAAAAPGTAAAMTGAFNGPAGAARKRGEASDAMEPLSV
jgi:hypothetical protein